METAVIGPKLVEIGKDLVAVVRKTTTYHDTEKKVSNTSENSLGY